MRDSSVYVTFDQINSESGAGLVCLHEINALKSVSGLQLVICRCSQDIGVSVQKLGIDRFYEFDPFLYDYFAAEAISEARISGRRASVLPVGEDIGLAHLGGGCIAANAILRELRPRRFVCTLVVSDMNENIEEHKKYFDEASYPFPYPWTNHWLTGVSLRYAKMANRVICPSTVSAEWIKRNVRPDMENIVIIPHGVDIPETVQSFPSDFKAGYLGAFGPVKGLAYLIEAWSKLDWNDAEMIFGGDCSQLPPDWIAGLSKTSAKFTMARRFPHRSVWEFYSNLSVYVQASVTEAFGIPVLEAMAAGRPVIVSKGAGSSDCVRDGVDGFVVPPRNPSAIMEKLTYFKDNPSELRRMGNNARRRASDFTWQKVEGLYCDVYRSLLS